MTVNKSPTKLTPADFEKTFAEKLSPYVRNKIRKYNFRYRKITNRERDGLIKRNFIELFDETIIRAGSHRRPQWEKGWGENLNIFSKVAMENNLTPKYFGKHNCIRWNQGFIIPISKNFEANSLALIQNWLFDKYLREIQTAYEFGCGTGINLLRLQEVNQKAVLWGLDWVKSSQKLINQIRKVSGSNIHGYNFDFFKPDYSFKLDKNGAVITISALEQIGTEFNNFVNYLLKNEPKICIHIEPIYELLDENNLMDFLSIKYIQKRNYLWGFLDHLRKLESKGKIKIIKAQRTYIGSLFVDGYSVIVWKPVLK